MRYNKGSPGFLEVKELAMYPYVVQQTTTPGHGWAVGDVVLRGGAQQRVVGLEGLFHTWDFSPIFISRGDVKGLSRGEGLIGCTMEAFDCLVHKPSCVLHIRYEAVVGNYLARSPDSS